MLPQSATVIPERVLHNKRLEAKENGRLLLNITLVSEVGFEDDQTGRDRSI